MRDRALRRLVADLAAANEEDIEAILSELGPHRRRIESLLAEYWGKATVDETPEPAPEAGAAALSELEGISLWLSARLVPPGETGDENPPANAKDSRRQDRLRRFRMTPLALEGLRRSAAELLPPAPAPEPRRGRSLLGQVHGALLGRGRLS